MDTIRKKYIIDENKNKVAVQIDIADFEKIERILEDYALVQLMKQNDPGENLSLNEGKTFYGKLIGCWLLVFGCWFVGIG